MDIEQVKNKLANIRSATATKHPKTLICELCDVIKFLLDKIDRIKTPIMTVLPKRDPMIPCQPPWPNKPPPGDEPVFLPLKKSPSIIPPHPHRKGNAGDAE